jgi:hypothetical protein
MRARLAFAIVLLVLTPAAAVSAWADRYQLYATATFFEECDEEYTALVRVAHGRTSRSPFSVADPVISGDGRRLFYDVAGQIWTLNLGRRTAQPHVWIRHDAAGTSDYLFPVVASPTGTELLVGRNGGTGATYGIYRRGREVKQLGKLPIAYGSWSTRGIIALSWAGDRIALLRLDGTRRVLKLRADAGLSWSPDGRQLLYAWNQDIYVANARGNAHRKVIKAAEWPSWSPDGDRIAYLAAEEDTYDPAAWTSRPDGSGERWIGRLPGDAQANTMWGLARARLPLGTAARQSDAQCPT